MYCLTVSCFRNLLAAHNVSDQAKGTPGMLMRAERKEVWPPSLMRTSGPHLAQPPDPDLIARTVHGCLACLRQPGIYGRRRCGWSAPGSKDLSHLPPGFHYLVHTSLVLHLPLFN